MNQPITETQEQASKRVFVLPTKPLSIIDAINRRALASGSWNNARAGSDADYNGHNVDVRWNEHRCYWVAQYQWGDRIVIARGELGHCVVAAKDFYQTQGRGASVSVEVESPEDIAIVEACGYVPADKEDTSWRDWKFEEINFALGMERAGFGPYAAHLIAATGPDDFKARCKADRGTSAIRSIVGLAA